VTNFKPVVGEQELRQSKQAATVHYVRVRADRVCEFGSTNLLEAYPVGVSQVPLNGASLE